MNRQPRKPIRGKRAIIELVESGPILSLDEVDARYEGDWVLLLVTGQSGETWLTTQGRVLDHSPSRKRISRTIVRVRDIYPDVLLFPYMAGPRLSPAEFRRRILEHDLPEEALRAWW